MDQRSILEQLGQVDSSEAGQFFREMVRGTVRQLVIDVMAEEVEAFCGPAYSRQDNGDGCRRGGSASTSVRIDGVQFDLRRPRVRRSEGTSEQEVPLESYHAAANADELREYMLRAFAWAHRARTNITLFSSTGVTLLDGIVSA